MRLSLVVSSETEDLIRSLPPVLKKKIRSGIDEILSHPECGKALIDDLEGFRSYRISDFRIVYRVHPKQIDILALGPRKTIYQKALIELSKIS